MAKYTTITVSKSVKEEVADGMSEDETWSEYLRRLHSENLEEASDGPNGGRTGENAARLQQVVQEAVDAQATNASATNADIDYDHIREIVREEVRRALEDLIR